MVSGFPGPGFEGFEFRGLGCRDYIAHMLGALGLGSLGVWFRVPGSGSRMEVGALALPKWGFPRITAIQVVGGLYWSPRMCGFMQSEF